jgi:hypothetical protein
MDTEHTNPVQGNISTSQVTARRIEEPLRLNALPRYFGRCMMRFESAVYGFMRRFAPDYRGGFWQFYELSNGGFYMAPDGESYRFCVDTNGYEGVMSANAAGITVCLFACSHLSFHDSHGELFAERFHQLREFALNHSEATEIFAAID